MTRDYAADREIAERLRLLYEKFLRQEDEYRGDNWPLSYLPENIDPKSKESANYIFFFVQIDYQTKGKRLVEKMKRAYVENNRIIDPEYIVSLSDDEVADIIRKCGGRFPTRDNIVWKHNAGVLLEKYDGDARNIGRNITVKELMDRMKDFMKFRSYGKLFWLLVSFMIDEDLGHWRILDIENVIIPVDIWLYRLGLALGWTKEKRYNKKAQYEIGKKLVKIAMLANVPISKVNHILWKHITEKCAKGEDCLFPEIKKYINYR